MGFIRRRARRRTMLVAGGLAYEAGKNRAPDEGEPEVAPAPEVPAAPPPPAPTAAAAGASPPADELQRLADLHSSGALTDEEFAAAKARVLGMDDPATASE